MLAPPVIGSAGFLALDNQKSDYTSSRAVIIPIPYDSTVSYQSGSREGPGAIISASHNVELFDEELLWTPAEVGIATLQPLEVDVRGPEWMIQTIRECCLGPVSQGKFVVAIGGEHTVSLGCLDAQISCYKEQLTVLHIDAHADLRDTYQKSKYSHACVMRRISEKCPAVSVGLRSLSQEEHEFITQQKLEPFSMETIRSDPDWIQKVVQRLGSMVYLTLDLDGLDPSVCPGVGTPEPGGLGWSELTNLLRAVYQHRQVVGADVVECLPLSGQHLSEFVAARLVYKMIGYRFGSGRTPRLRTPGNPA